VRVEGAGGAFNGSSCAQATHPPAAGQPQPPLPLPWGPTALQWCATGAGRETLDEGAASAVQGSGALDVTPGAARAPGAVGVPGAAEGPGSALVGAPSGSPAYKLTPFRIVEYVEEEDEGEPSRGGAVKDSEDTNSHPYSDSDLEPSYLPWSDAGESSSEGEVEQGREGRRGRHEKKKRKKSRPDFFVSSKLLPVSRK